MIARTRIYGAIVRSFIICKLEARKTPRQSCSYISSLEPILISFFSSQPQTPTLQHNHYHSPSSLNLRCLPTTPPPRALAPTRLPAAAALRIRSPPVAPTTRATTTARATTAPVLPMATLTTTQHVSTTYKFSRSDAIAKKLRWLVLLQQSQWLDLLQLGLWLLQLHSSWRQVETRLL